MNKFNRAFSLVEVLIALLILGMGIVGLFNLFPLAFNSLAYAKKLNEVYFLAEKKLEELKSKGIPGQAGLEGKEGDLAWKLTSQPVNISDGIDLTSVQVDVSFSFHSKQESQRFVTYLNLD
jgi:prepilin-type N-terminal cleavage/methylation domain-containing protein